MFGFGKEKKGPRAEEWTFDLEKDLLDAGKKRQIKEKIDQSVQNLKAMLRQGEDKKTFDNTQTLLHGYLALQKVSNRVGRQM